MKTHKIRTFSNLLAVLTAMVIIVVSTLPIHAAGQPYAINLTPGHYTAGIDIPVGTYNCVAVSGKGNAISSNSFLHGGINQMMGVGDPNYITTFSGLILPAGAVLTITSTLTLGIASNDTDVAGMKPRTENTAMQFGLTPGNYTCGVNFPAGTYDIVASDKHGNVISSCSSLKGGINALMGVNYSNYVPEYKNVSFAAGDTLKLSRVSVIMIPVQ